MKLPKGLRQDINIKHSGNLSSYGIWSVSVDLLKKPLLPLMLYTDVGIETLLTCVALTTTRTRKIAFMEAPEMLPIMFNLAARAHVDRKDQTILDDLFQTGVERNIAADHIERYLVSPVKPSNPRIDSDKLRAYVITHRNAYLDFRRDVMHRYRYLVESLANRAWAIKARQGLVIEKEGMQNIYMLTAFRAIDKFIPTKGTLSSYLQQWLAAAKSSTHLTFNNEAVSLDRAERQRIHNQDSDMRNKPVPLEDRENELLVEPEEVQDHSQLHNVAKYKFATLFFLANGLDYPLNRKQLERINANNNRRPASRAEGTGNSSTGNFQATDCHA